MQSLTRFRLTAADGRTLGTYPSPAQAEAAAAKLTEKATVERCEEPIAPLVFDLPGDDPFADLITG